MGNLNFFRKKLFYGILSFLVPFIVYQFTLAPTVSFIDCGELATVCIKLGIAHPTGYPLFTLLGRLFTMLPFFHSLAFSLNFMASVLCALSCFVFFNLLVYLFNLPSKNESNDSSKLAKSNVSKSGKIDNLIIYIISLSASLILAFSKTFWDTANAIEVYSLHTFFLVVVIHLFLKAAQYTHKAREVSLKHEKYWLGFAFILGLSFSNHMTTIFLSVGTLYYYFSINGFNKSAFQRILLLAVPFLIGFSVYIYYPVRANNPFISWGHPDTFDNFYRHISGKQFSIWMFSSMDTASKQFSYFIKSFPAEFYYFPLILALIGAFEFFKFNRKVFIFTAILFSFNVLYAINYDIYDIDSYFLLAYIVTVIWMAFGILSLSKRFSKHSFNIAIASLFLFLIPAGANYKLSDESKNYYVKDYTFNVFKSAKPNSIIMSTQWDFWVSASFYFQFIENIRPDIVVIDKELLRKSWYLRHLEIHYPEIYDRSRLDFDAYKVELLKFEAETKQYTNPTTEADRQNLLKIQSTYANLLNGILDKNIKEREFYTTFEVEQDKKEIIGGKEYLRIPEGLLIKYTKDKNFDEKYVEPEFNYTITRDDTYHHSFLMNAYYNSFLSRANYLMNFSRFDAASKYIDKAIEIYPQKSDARGLQKKLMDLRSGTQQP